MTRLIAAALQWLVRHAVLLLVIMAVLVAGRWLLAQHQRLDADRIALAAARADLAALDDEPARIAAWIGGLVPPATDLSRSADELRRVAATERERREREKAALEARHPLASRMPGSPVYLQAARLGLEIAVLERAQRQVEAQALLIGSLHDIGAARERIATARRLLASAIDANRSRRRALWAKHTVLREIPGTLVYREIDRLDDAHRPLLRNIAALDTHTKQLDASEALARGLVGAVRTTPADVRRLGAATRHAAEQRAAALGRQVQANPWRRVSEEFTSVLWPALAILALAVASGPIAKALLYYVVAPFAANRPPMRLLPGAAGDVRARVADGHLETGNGKVSGSSLALTLRDDEELWVHADFLQSRSSTAAVSTKFWLDPTRPFTSLAAGLFLLHRVVADRSRALLLSSTRHDLLELAAIELPAASAFVLRPRGLVGIVQPIGRPIRITSHWRFASLHGWLSLQLRYLVFHGPGQLIVKGSRGVILESAADGRVINQAGVLGFSAGVERSTARCDTFLPYLRGQQDLFNDRFHGAGGWFVYEEMPSPGAPRSLLFGKGFAGLADSVLKVFGI